MVEAAPHAASGPVAAGAGGEVRWEDLVWAGVVYQFGRDADGYMVRRNGEEKVLFRAADLAGIETQLKAAEAERAVDLAVDLALELLRTCYGPGGWVFGHDGQRWWAVRKGAPGSLLEAPGPVELAQQVNAFAVAGTSGATS
jgi:hypothetical protein